MVSENVFPDGIDLVSSASSSTFSTQGHPSSLSSSSSSASSSSTSSSSSSKSPLSTKIPDTTEQNIGNNNDPKSFTNLLTNTNINTNKHHETPNPLDGPNDSIKIEVCEPTELNTIYKLQQLSISQSTSSPHQPHVSFSGQQQYKPRNPPLQKYSDEPTILDRLCEEPQSITPSPSPSQLHTQSHSQPQSQSQKTQNDLKSNSHNLSFKPSQTLSFSTLQKQPPSYLSLSSSLSSSSSSTSTSTSSSTSTTSQNPFTFALGSSYPSKNEVWEFNPISNETPLSFSNPSTPSFSNFSNQNSQVSVISSSNQNSASNSTQSSFMSQTFDDDMSNNTNHRNSNWNPPLISQSPYPSITATESKQDLDETDDLDMSDCDEKDSNSEYKLMNESKDIMYDRNNGITNLTSTNNNSSINDTDFKENGIYVDNSPIANGHSPKTSTLTRFNTRSNESNNKNIQSNTNTNTTQITFNSSINNEQLEQQQVPKNLNSNVNVSSDSPSSVSSLSFLNTPMTSSTSSLPSSTISHFSSTREPIFSSPEFSQSLFGSSNARNISIQNLTPSSSPSSSPGSGTRFNPATTQYNSSPTPSHSHNINSLHTSLHPHSTSSTHSNNTALAYRTNLLKDRFIYYGPKSEKYRASAHIRRQEQIRDYYSTSNTSKISKKQIAAPTRLRSSSSGSSNGGSSSSAVIMTASIANGNDISTTRSASTAVSIVNGISISPSISSITSQHLSPSPQKKKPRLTVRFNV